MTNPQDPVRDAIQDAVRAALPELGDVDFDATLTSDIGLDSVQIMDLVMEIEDRLDISIPIEILAETTTLNELAGRLRPLHEGKPGA